MINLKTSIKIKIHGINNNMVLTDGLKMATGGTIKIGIRMIMVEKKRFNLVASIIFSINKEETLLIFNQVN